MKNKTVSATVAVLVVEVIFGFSFLFSKTAMQFASPLVLIADRFTVAFVLLTAVMLIAGIKFRIGKNVWKPIAMAMFQPVLYFVFESYGINMPKATPPHDQLEKLRSTVNGTRLNIGEAVKILTEYKKGGK